MPPHAAAWRRFSPLPLWASRDMPPHAAARRAPARGARAGTRGRGEGAYLRCHAEARGQLFPLTRRAARGDLSHEGRGEERGCDARPDWPRRAARGDLSHQGRGEERDCDARRDRLRAPRVARGDLPRASRHPHVAWARSLMRRVDPRSLVHAHRLRRTPLPLCLQLRARRVQRRRAVRACAAGRLRGAGDHR